MDYRTDIWLHFVFGALAVVGLILARLGPLRRFRRQAFVLLGLIGLAGFFNFGQLRHYHDVGFVNRWELFHYQLGSKYFPELGYDGLYAASVAAQRETHPDRPIAPFMRDLRINRLQPTASQRPHITEVRARFSEDRWQSFQRDHTLYLESMTARSLHAIRRDHGYNPTPQWTFVARIFSATLPTDDEALSLIAGLDVLLLAGAMALVFATYSMEVGCFVLAIAGLGFGWHYTYLGAFLRLDWWAAVLAAVCLLKRERFALAGACIGYATLSRLFPGALLIGPAVVAVRELRAGATPRWAARLSAGFVIAVVIGLSAGSLAGRGPNAWVEFADRIDRHMGTWTTNAVGLRQVVANDPGYIVARINDPNLERNVGTRMTHRGPLRALLATVLCAMAVGLMWRLAPADAAIAGIVCVFALTAPSSYYWILLALLPMYQRTEPSLALLAFFVGLFACELVLEGVEHLPTHYALMSWGLFFFLFGWLLVALRDVLSPVGSRETDG